MSGGRPIRGLFAGLFLGICLDLVLIFGGFVKLDSAVLSVLPIALSVVGLLLGLWAPIGRSRLGPARTAAPLPTPAAWPESAPFEDGPGTGRGGSTGEPPPPPPLPI